MKKWIGLFLLVFLGFSPSVFGGNIDPSAISDPYAIAVDASGALYITSFSHLYKITPHGVMTELPGMTPPPALSAIAVDKSGNVYVADSTANVIWKVTPGGVWTILAGSKGVAGAANGTGTGASFYWPSGIAVDSSGNVYVADLHNSLIRKINRKGVVTTLAGGGPGSAVDGKGTAASFNTLSGVAVDKSGNVYVSDAGSALIRKITPGGVVTTLAGSEGVFGAANGTGTSATFGKANGIAVDKSGNIYVVDGNNLIRKITPRGVVTTLAGSTGVAGAANGTGTQALFNGPSGIAVDKSGNVYVADSDNNSIRKITPRGVVTTLAGAGPETPVNGTASAGAGGASASPASSGPITLVCTPALGKSDPAQLILDEGAGTADFGSDPVTTATFTDTTVSWQLNTQEPNVPITDERWYSLSRLTGVLTFTIVRGTTDTNGNTRWSRGTAALYNCKIGVEKRLF